MGCHNSKGNNKLSEFKYRNSQNEKFEEIEKYEQVSFSKKFNNEKYSNIIAEQILKNQNKSNIFLEKINQNKSLTQTEILVKQKSGDSDTLTNDTQNIDEFKQKDSVKSSVLTEQEKQKIISDLLKINLKNNQKKLKYSRSQQQQHQSKQQQNSYDEQELQKQESQFQQDHQIKKIITDQINTIKNRRIKQIIKEYQTSGDQDPIKSYQCRLYKKE